MFTDKIAAAVDQARKEHGRSVVQKSPSAQPKSSLNRRTQHQRPQSPSFKRRSPAAEAPNFARLATMPPAPSSDTWSEPRPWQAELSFFLCLFGTEVLLRESFRLRALQAPQWDA